MDLRDPVKKIFRINSNALIILFLFNLNLVKAEQLLPCVELYASIVVQVHILLFICLPRVLSGEQINGLMIYY